jgi:hypothetical protein
MTDIVDVIQPPKLEVMRYALTDYEWRESVRHHLPHNRRWRHVSDQRTALVGPNLGDGVELAIHLHELGFSLSIGI